MIKAIIVDDENEARDLLSILLNEYFNDVQIIGVAASALEGVKLIQKGHPDVLFLDVQMPGGTGFDLLEAIPNRKFEVVFTSAHQKFALKAIKEEAKDFLVKPIDIDDLEGAINRVRKIKNSKQAQNSISSRIQIPVSGGIKFIEPNNISRIKGDGNYTTVYLLEGEKILVTKNMKQMESLLSSKEFFRSHNSHMVNLDYIKEFSRIDGSFIIMSDGTTVPLSRRKKDEFINLIG